MFNLLYGKSASGKSYYLDNIDKTIVVRCSDLIVSTSQKNTLIIDDACWLTNKLDEILKAIKSFMFSFYFDAELDDVVVVMNKITLKFLGDKNLSEAQMTFARALITLDVFKGTSLKIDEPYNGMTSTQIEVYNHELLRKSSTKKWIRVWVASSDPQAVMSLYDLLLSSGEKVKFYVSYIKYFNNVKRYHVSDGSV